MLLQTGTQETEKGDSLACCQRKKTSCSPGLVREPLREKCSDATGGPLVLLNTSRKKGNRLGPGSSAKTWFCFATGTADKVSWPPTVPTLGLLWNSAGQ